MPDDYANKKYPIPNDLMTVEELEERIKHMEEIVFPAILERTQKINEEYSPYTVARKNRGGSYELKDEQNALLHRNYTPSELKVVNMDESNIENEYYEVEDIRDHRGPIGHREFLVKWAGYGERANTWQKASDFTDPTIIEKYWDKQDELKKLERERAEQIVNKASSNSKHNESNRNSTPKVSVEKEVYS
ncbi:hypothetical protein RO3G_00299 [Rhizopus delemar RA 99-880]|uniref:Chromo domain-containing protein n=1 Tax=Rhizopus delemar (strain RA 99-880 / ATCC MYA-4621 / FGSC 9543 / NRRL 43880) TaxID=246409 RepID=I1BHB5_RHIO9|nr:hypothetical protein RO3G_00299 [Rhizopus delemar RA 99-880]|eukprot:EIE75595.1 hypothetical protein RO3G_00299 [Rhizopus delemar RA 99-880]